MAENGTDGLGVTRTFANRADTKVVTAAMPFVVVFPFSTPCMRRFGNTNKSESVNPALGTMYTLAVWSDAHVMMDMDVDHTHSSIPITIVPTRRTIDTLWDPANIEANRMTAYCYVGR